MCAARPQHFSKLKHNEHSIKQKQTNKKLAKACHWTRDNFEQLTSLGNAGWYDSRRRNRKQTATGARIICEFVACKLVAATKTPNRITLRALTHARRIITVATRELSCDGWFCWSELEMGFLLLWLCWDKICLLVARVRGSLTRGCRTYAQFQLHNATRCTWIYKCECCDSWMILSRTAERI